MRIRLFIPCVCVCESVFPDSKYCTIIINEWMIHIFSKQYNQFATSPLPSVCQEPGPDQNTFGKTSTNWTAASISSCPASLIGIATSGGYNNQNSAIDWHRRHFHFKPTGADEMSALATRHRMSNFSLNTNRDCCGARLELIFMENFTLRWL